jgi:SulP family sulfate permease
LYCYHHEEIFKLIRLYTKVDYKTEVLSGLTVALALIPEAVALL